MQRANAKDMQGADPSSKPKTWHGNVPYLEMQVQFVAFEVGRIAGVAGLRDRRTLVQYLIHVDQGASQMGIGSEQVLIAELKRRHDQVAEITMIVGVNDLARTNRVTGCTQRRVKIPALVGFRRTIRVLPDHAERVGFAAHADMICDERPSD